MATWQQVSAAAPELAAEVQGRFEATGLAMLATLKKDGSPRISGLELTFHDGEWWFGSMPEARKDADLRRDPRIALHAATEDKDVKRGDAKIEGRALLIEDDETFNGFVASLSEAGHPPPPGRFPLYRVDVTAVSMLKPVGDHLDIRWWTEAKGLNRVDRY